VAVLNKGHKLFEGNVGEVLAISDSFELATHELEKLQSIISSHPAYRSSTIAGDKLQVYFKDEVKPGDLNVFCFSQGITLTHLSERKRSLEQHFLELLEDIQ
jgi:ABC-2 type transport system ATP-binding protein